MNLPDPRHGILQHAAAELAIHPKLLHDLAEAAKLELLRDLDASRDSGEQQTGINRLITEDEEAQAMENLLRLGRDGISIDAAPAVGAQSSAFVAEIFSAAIETLRALYRQESHPVMAAASPAADSEETILPIAGVAVKLRRFRRPDGYYDIELVVPAGSGVDPAQLSGYCLKIIDRPYILDFGVRRDGTLVASTVLPPSLAKPEKEIAIVPPGDCASPPATF